MATKEYELVADSYNETTSKPGEPFTYKTYGKGEKIKLDDEQARRLIESGAVKETGSKAAPSDSGAQTKAPKGKAEGVGDGDADEGSIGDGGPDPQGTGSTQVGDGGGPGDGQGSADGNPAASTATRGRASAGKTQGAKS